MIEYCLKPNPNATKLKAVKGSLLRAKPAVADLNNSLLGMAWRKAMERFQSLKATAQLLETQVSQQDKPLSVTEVVPERLRGALSVTGNGTGGTGSGLVGTGSPVQVNINVTSDPQKGTGDQHNMTGKGLPPANSGSQMTNKALAEQAKRLRALAKRTNQVRKTLIQKDVTYLGLLSGIKMVLGEDAKALTERVMALIIDLEGLTCLRNSSLCD